MARTLQEHGKAIGIEERVVRGGRPAHEHLGLLVGRPPLAAAVDGGRVGRVAAHGVPERLVDLEAEAVGDHLRHEWPLERRAGCVHEGGAEDADEVAREVRVVMGVLEREQQRGQRRGGREEGADGFG